jgi:hypothetical protein
MEGNMSIRKLLAESRQSGPATKYELDPNGTILSKTERPARSVYRAGRLTQEERLCLLTQTGEWPEDHPAEANIGVQANDNHGYSESGGPDLRDAGIMSGINAEGYTSGTGYRALASAAHRMRTSGGTIKTDA